MAAKMSVLGLILSPYPYLRSEMVRFPLPQRAPHLTEGENLVINNYYCVIGLDRA